jgi:hypothetical protein
MPESTSSDKKEAGSDKDPTKYELIDSEGVFSDMYLRDVNLEKRIQGIAESKQLRKLQVEAQKRGRSLELLDEVVPEDPTPLPLFKRFVATFKVFKTTPEYGSKEAYLGYLKSAYRFMMQPLEDPPGIFYRIFYQARYDAWAPSSDEARELLEKFYIETQLIRNLSDEDWRRVRAADDPEVVLNKLLYGIKFKPEFENFLHNIPWLVSHDRYGAPALDLVRWNPPGTDVPQKPIGVDDEFIDELVEGVREQKSYARIEVDDKFVELRNKKQILRQLKKDERVLIDSYVGVSKLERDFVLHKRLILWRNVGYETWKKDREKGKAAGARPQPYLVMLQERAQHLEIPFVTLAPAKKKSKDKERETGVDIDMD